MTSFVPDDFVVPRELVCEGFWLEPLGPEHNEGDYRAWTSSISHIRATPGFQGRQWPVPEMSLAENLADLERHAADFTARSGFTYTVRASGSDEIIGCVYIYPTAGGSGGSGGPGGSGGSGGSEGSGGSVGPEADVRSWVSVGPEADVRSWVSAGSEADVRSWVSAGRAALDVALYEAVSDWLRSAWPFTAVRYAPRERRLAES